MACYLSAELMIKLAANTCKGWCNNMTKTVSFVKPSTKSKVIRSVTTRARCLKLTSMMTWGLVNFCRKLTYVSTYLGKPTK